MKPQLFTELYRPTTLEDLVLPDRVRQIFSKGLVQNYLLQSKPGLGKTTMARILGTGKACRYFNISDESSVEVIRTKIEDFCSSTALGFNGGIKCVILDELDGASDQFFKAIRGTIEKFAANTRFVATCNYLNKIPVAVQERFELTLFDAQTPEEEAQVKRDAGIRMVKLASENGITIKPDALIEFVNTNWPSLRKMTSKIQNWKTCGITEVDLTELKKINWSYADLYELILSNTTSHKVYSHLRTFYSTRIEDALDALASDFPDWLNESHPKLVDQALPYIIVEVWKHQSSLKNVIDPLIALHSCVFSIQSVIRKLQKV